MQRLGVAVLCGVAGAYLAATGTAGADILVNVSKSSQRMSVLVDGTAQHYWKISSGRGRYATPNGVFQPTWTARKWRSKQYQNAPMPYSIFFNRGYAIHGTTEISRLGRPASHGCIRLHPKDAAILFDLVKNRLAQTHIVVSNDAIEEPKKPPQASPLVAELPGPPDVAQAAASGAPASDSGTEVLVEKGAGAQPALAAAIEPAAEIGPAAEIEPVIAIPVATAVEPALAAAIEPAVEIESAAEIEPVIAIPVATPVEPVTMPAVAQPALAERPPALETAGAAPAMTQSPAQPVRTAARARAGARSGFHW